MTYTNYFGGNLVQPGDVSFSAIEFTENDELIQLAWPSTYLSSVPNQTVFSQILKVDASFADCILQLPDQTQVSVGQTIFIYNSGTESFLVNPFYGTQVAVIEPGQYYSIWLTDNTNAVDIPHWSSAQQGSSVTQVNAADLVGKGLIAQGLTLNRNRNTQISAGSYNLQPTDRDTFFIYQGGVGTFTLPNAGTVGNGWQVSANNNSSTGGVLTVNPQTGQFIDSFNSFDIDPGESITFITDGSNWYSLGYSQLVQFSYGVNNLVLSGLGASYTLTGAQAQQSFQQYSGVLTQNVTVYFPPTPYTWYVENATSGPYTVSLQLINEATPLGNIINIVQGESIIIYSDETTLKIIPNVSASSFPLLAPNGSLDAPSYSFSESSNTGMFFDSTIPGSLVFSANGNVAMTLDGSGDASIQNLTVNENTSLSELFVSGDTNLVALDVTGASSLNGLTTLGQQLVLSSTAPLNQRIVFGTTPSLSLGSVADSSSIQFQTGAGPYTSLMNINATNITFNVPAVFSAGQSAASFLATAQGSNTAPAFGLSGQQTGMYFPTTTSVSFTAGGTQTLASSAAANTFYSPIATSGAGVNTTSFNNLSPCTTAGDMIAYNGTNNVRVPASTRNNEVLLSAVAGIPVWGGYSILQVVNARVSSNAVIALSALNQATAITASITPSAINSQILVIVELFGCVDIGSSTHPGQTNVVYWSIYRNSTPIKLIAGYLNALLQNAGGSLPSPQSYTILDSPASTSSISYTVYLGPGSNLPSNAYINRSQDGAITSSSNITLIELGGF